MDALQLLTWSLILYLFASLASLVFTRSGQTGY